MDWEIGSSPLSGSPVRSRQVVAVSTSQAAGEVRLAEESSQTAGKPDGEGTGLVSVAAAAVEVPLDTMDLHIPGPSPGKDDENMKPNSEKEPRANKKPVDVEKETAAAAAAEAPLLQRLTSTPLRHGTTEAVKTQTPRTDNDVFEAIWPGC